MSEGKPFCLNCFDTMFSEYCDYCGESIGVDQGQMSHDGQHWHATDECFSCSTCRCSLLGKRFLPKRGLIYCSIMCSKGKMVEDDADENSEASQRDEDDRDANDCPPKFIEAPQTHAHSHNEQKHNEMRPPPPRPYQKQPTAAATAQPFMPITTVVESNLESSESEEDATPPPMPLPTAVRRERELNNSLSSTSSHQRHHHDIPPPKVNTVRFDTTRRPDTFSLKSTRSSHDRSAVDTRSIRSSGEIKALN